MTKNKFRGKVWAFGDDINTDIIIPFRFKSRTNDPYELAKYAMYGHDPDFSKKISKGDIIVGGKNFGGGSSREQAPIAIKYAGISAIIAEGFARIFFRNSVNIGLPILEVDNITKLVKQGDELEIDLSKREITIVKSKKLLQAKRNLTGFMAETMKAGGLVEYYKKFKRFPWE